MAFEYCGLHWHGQLVNGKEARLKHLNKLDACTKAGITLITIFADEWLTRNEIVRDRVAALLGCSHVSIGARKCEVKEISIEEAKIFEEKYHLQGTGLRSFNIGLYFQGQLVAVGAFKSSYAQYKKAADPAFWELTRYTLKSGVRVQGGLGKILGYFKQMRPLCTKLISFADRRWSTGKLYAACGFDLEKVVTPDYRYFKINTEFPRIHKFNMRRKKLIKVYGCDPASTEWPMAQFAGFDRIFDCGLEKWVKTYPGLLAL
jgi:hypothetical protein